jgi:hypothetical protein
MQRAKYVNMCACMGAKKICHSGILTLEK